MKIYKKVTELIGNTPLLELGNYEKAHGLEATILAKLEYLNPAGSVKDRIARAMLDDAERRGLLKPGSVIIERRAATRESVWRRSRQRGGIGLFSRCRKR